jgi:putative aldouronate transport system substrate-binding protein
MKTNSRSVAMVFIVLVLLLTACSGNKGDTGGKGATATPTATTNQENGKGEDNKKEDPVSIKILANFGRADLTEYEKAFFKKVEEALNIKLDIIIPPASGYVEQLQLTLVSGDVPDAVFFPSEQDEMFINAVKDGAVIPINSYLDKSDNLKAYSYEHSWDALKTLQDENIYGIPRTSISRNDGFIVRKDWLDKLGIEIPADNEVTLEQFNEILRAFTFDDPDKNNRKDTYGVGSFVDKNKVLQPVLLSELGHYGWQKADGGEYPYTLPEYDTQGEVYKNILLYTKKLYEEGSLDPDSPINDSAAASDRFKQGVTGVLRGFAGHVNAQEKVLKEINPQAELTYLFVKGPDNKVQGTGFGTGIWGVWTVTAKSKHPEKVVQVFDYMLSDEGWDYLYYGVEGVDYTIVNGEKAYKPDVSRGIATGIMRRHNAPEFFLEPSKFTKEELDRVKPWVDKAVATVITSLDKGFVPPAARQPNYMDYKLNWDELTTRMMLGDLPIEQLDQVRENWYKNGGELFMQEMNEFIKSLPN